MELDAYNGNDAITLMTDNTGTTTNLYDAAGRLIGINYPTGASIRYELDKLDRITTITNRASSTGTAYVIRYAYDAVGNITNVTDPFGGVTTLEYDRVGRRTKRTLPNGITTEWQYNWRDQVTNIVHKNSAGTVLARVAYERATFGEPTKITWEDDSHVVLKYDAALRLTNEQHYASGGALIESIGYGYDASGSRIRLINNNGVFTNSVEKGYRVTNVKRQSDGATTETYAYDTGGRMTSINRAAATLTLGYNTSDELTAVTNGANWTQYTHDALGRRIKASDQSGAERRFLVANTPGTDLQSPHLIADVNNTLKQGYIYLGHEPMMRFDATGSSSRKYYLEDGMGSVIALAPEGSPDAANTSRLFYDAFGTSRNTNGAAPSIPPGIGGDFRFHRSWWEVASQFHNMRAREYDSSAGRFMSRDARAGLIQRPESFQPYTYAAANPHAFTDPSGEFTLTEITVDGALRTSLQAIRTVAINRLKNKAKDDIVNAVGRVTGKAIGELYPGADEIFKLLFEGKDKFAAGLTFEAHVKAKVCSLVPANVAHYIAWYASIDANGSAQSDGFKCPNPQFPSYKAGMAYPDFIFGENSPTSVSAGKGDKSVLIGDIKLSGNSLYNKYVVFKKESQFHAMTRYAGKHTYTHIVFFLTVFSGERGKMGKVGRLLQKDAVKDGVVVIVFSSKRNKGY